MHYGHGEKGRSQLRLTMASKSKSSHASVQQKKMLTDMLLHDRYMTQGGKLAEW